MPMDPGSHNTSLDFDDGPRATPHDAFVVAMRVVSVTSDSNLTHGDLVRKRPRDLPKFRVVFAASA